MTAVEGPPDREVHNVRSRLALAAATTIGGLALTLGSGGTAQAADGHPPRVTWAGCVSTGGVVVPIGLAGAVCWWTSADGSIESAQIIDLPWGT